MSQPCIIPVYLAIPVMRLQRVRCTPFGPVVSFDLVTRARAEDVPSLADAGREATSFGESIRRQSGGRDGAAMPSAKGSFGSAWAASLPKTSRRTSPPHSNTLRADAIEATQLFVALTHSSRPRLNSSAFSSIPTETAD